MDERWRRRRMGLWVAAGTLLLGLGLGEIGFRVYVFHLAPRYRVAKWARHHDMPPHALRYEPHPYFCYALNPRFRSDDGRDRHGFPGFRGEDLAPKGDGVYRIACVGGSSTYDTEIPDWRLAYPARLEEVLREEHGRGEIEVVNCGVPGYSTFESLVHLQFRVLPVVDPDLILVYHATNDVHARLVTPETYRPDNTGYRHAWRESPRPWDRSLLGHALGVQLGFSQRNRLRDWVMVQEGRPPLSERAARLAANPPVHFRRNLESMVVLGRHHGAEVVLMSWASSPHHGDYAATDVYRRGFREHNAVCREAASALDAPFLDLASLLPEDPAYWDDGRHNNARGARRKAELVADFLVSRVLP